MPEGPEVEKLRRQLQHAWLGRTFGRIESIWDPMKSGKFFVDNMRTEFEHKIQGLPVVTVSRHGKWMEVRSQTGPIFAFHLGGTGWFLPEEPQDLPPSFPHKNFLHKVNDKAKRLVFNVLGSHNTIYRWGYHDGRTWGKFILPQEWEVPLPWADYGPDWLKDPAKAAAALFRYKTKGVVTVKQVLCDPYIASGLGNYLSCEACFRGKVRPNTPWRNLDDYQKLLLAEACNAVVEFAMGSDNHEWWSVFKRAGQECMCGCPIAYEKDPGGSRGSYYCPNCQA